MWAVILLVAMGFAAGMYINYPVTALNGKYLALAFLAVMDSLTYGLAHDLHRLRLTNRYVSARLVLSLTFGGFIIFFGEKSGIDLYLVALLPLAFGLAINLYKFLPK